MTTASWSSSRPVLALHAGLVHGVLGSVSMSPVPFTIRTAAEPDCEALAGMRRRLQQLLEQESPSLWRMTDARKLALPQFYAQSIGDPGVQVLVAEIRESDASAIVGTAIGRLEVGRDVARFGSIEDVWVEPEHRGRGICRALMLELTRFFQSHGVHELTLGFAYGGSAAGLWKRLGFEPAVVIANASVDVVRARSK